MAYIQRRMLPVQEMVDNHINNKNQGKYVLIEQNHSEDNFEHIYQTSLSL